MIVSSVVPVAVAVSLGALAAVVSVGLAWNGARHLRPPVFTMFAVESFNLLLPLGVLNGLVGSFGYRSVVALVSFFSILYLQEVCTTIISVGMVMIIYEKNKIAGFLPEYIFRWRNSGRDFLFQFPLFLLFVGLLLSFFPPRPYSHIVLLLGFLWVTGVISFLAKVWPEEKVLKRMAISWILRIVLAVSLYFVVIPLIAQTLDIEMHDGRWGEDPVEYRAKREQLLREILPKIDAFLTTYEGIAAVLLALVYKIAVLGTIGGAGRLPWNLPDYELNGIDVPSPPAAAPAQEQGAEDVGSTLESEPLVPSRDHQSQPIAQALAAPSAPQRYPFYM